jgi:hypothetical protein
MCTGADGTELARLEVKGTALYVELSTIFSQLPQA